MWNHLLYKALRDIISSLNIYKNKWPTNHKESEILHWVMCHMLYPKQQQTLVKKSKRQYRCVPVCLWWGNIKLSAAESGGEKLIHIYWLVTLLLGTPTFLMMRLFTKPNLLLTTPSIHGNISWFWERFILGTSLRSPSVTSFPQGLLGKTNW